MGVGIGSGIAGLCATWMLPMPIPIAIPTPTGLGDCPTTELCGRGTRRRMSDPVVSRHGIPGMIGGGYYDAHSAPQRVAMLAVADWLDAGLDSMLEAAPSIGSIVIADFGSAEGANAVAGTGRLIDAVRKRTDRPIQAV